MGHRHGITTKTLGGRNPYDDFFDCHNHTRAPVLVQWMATARCPLSCPHCLAGEATSGEELSGSEVERLLDEVASLGVRELLVTGGEPLERQDLPAVIDMMRERSIRWSLNTSVYPGPESTRAMRSHPPAFVAVSLDGPEAFHDRFRGRKGALRESLAALELYADLTDGNAAAGTTVHAQNFPHLDETLRIVAASRASSWGLHLTFPEGRARHADGLRLSRRQLRRFLSFVESRRRWFPVVLADEIGFCGEWEPALRQAPFFCGAGRAQCVVLPDGEVVPCSTMDPDESAGNVRHTTLEQIWRTGFGRIRNFRPRGKCGGCEYLPACEGGCWLQRRHGTQCFRDVWGSWNRVAAPASIVACLGLGACGSHPAQVEEPPTQEEPAVQEEPAIDEPAGDTIEIVSPDPAPQEPAQPLDTTDPEILEHAVIGWHMRQACRHHSVVDLTPEQAEKLAGDPAGKYLAQVEAGVYPDSVEKRTKRILAALETQYRSLAFLSLLWRDLMLLCLEGETAAPEAAKMREALDAIAEKADLWSKEIFEHQLDSFVHAGPSGRHHFFMFSKAMMPGEAFKAQKAGMSMEHWGMKEIDEEVTDKHMKEHPFGGHMSLELKKKKGKSSLGIFDVLNVKKGKKPVILTFTSGDSSYEVKLQPGKKYLYGDVLRLLYEQNKTEMDEAAAKVLGSHTVPDPQPIWLPALEKKTSELAPEPKSDVCFIKDMVLSIWLF